MSERDWDRLWREGGCVGRGKTKGGGACIVRAAKHSWSRNPYAEHSCRLFALRPCLQKQSSAIIDACMVRETC